MGPQTGRGTRVTTSERITTAGITARIERLPMSGWQRRVRLLVGAVTLFDGFDQLLIAYALPVIKHQWRLGAAGATWAITAGSVGMLVGAVLAGWLGDLIGRVRAVAVCVTLYAVTSLLLVGADGLTMFLPLRFVQGIGIGGEVLVAAAYISEIIGARRRGRFVLLYELVFVVGLLAAALVSSWVIPAWGWRPLFVIGGVPLVFAVLLWRRVPESPRWLAARGRLTEADATLRRIEHEVGGGAPLPEPRPGDPMRVGGARLVALRGRRYARRTAVLVVLCFAAYLVTYALTSWLPTIYTELYHVPIAAALRYSLFSMASGLVGSTALALAVDRFGRKPCLTIGMVGAAVMLAVLALLHPADAATVALLVSAATLFVFSVNLGINLYVPELYPNRARTVGSSISGVAVRLGVIVGPILVGLLYTRSTGFPLVIGLLAVVALIGGVTLARYGEETANRTLERLSP